MWWRSSATSRFQPVARISTHRESQILARRRGRRAGRFCNDDVTMVGRAFRAADNGLPGSSGANGTPDLVTTDGTADTKYWTG